MCLARIQIRVVLFVVIMNRLLLLLVLLLFQFIDSIGYRLPIMIVGQPKNMLQKSEERRGSSFKLDSKLERVVVVVIVSFRLS